MSSTVVELTTYTDSRLPGYTFTILPRYKAEIRRNGELVRSFDFHEVGMPALTQNFVEGYFECLAGAASEEADKEEPEIVAVD